ncbi:hypothetical protein OpiT1DRAFT_03218 [Opitutaceae bacterium TAV1]|nr:hypothetical protein OpiT1DRAFT_03218 [Opitutaceae bacterium TAV1]
MIPPATAGLPSTSSEATATPAATCVPPIIAAERVRIAALWARWLPGILARQCCDGSENDGAFAEDDTGWYCGRHTAYTLARLMAARLWLDELYPSPTLSDIPCVSAAALDSACVRALAFLRRRQSPDGRLDLNGMYAANEIGFPVTGLALAWARFRDLGLSPAPGFIADLATFLRRGAEAILAGSPMTANHRWSAVAAPLAALHHLWPDPRYLARIESLLAEGIDIDADGCWHEERSPNYNNVASQGLLALADALGRPELLTPLTRHGEFLLHGIQPGGEFDSTLSHRQDRALPDRIAVTCGIARRLALLTGDGRYTSLCDAGRPSASAPEAELVPLLLQLDAHPGPLPAPRPLPDRYEVFYASVPQARLRTPRTLVSLSADPGGHYYDTVRDQWGGARRSDDWLHIHHGGVVIETLHLAGAGMQNLQPETLRRLAAGHYELSARQPGWEHTLHFSPGSPRVHVRWDWETSVAFRRSGDTARLTLASASPHSLMASLVWWVRPGALLLQSGGPGRTLCAGDVVVLAGGSPLRLESADGAAIGITGLPAAAHTQPVLFPPAIPSSIPQTCAALHLGLLFPVDLDLALTFL